MKYTKGIVFLCLTTNWWRFTLVNEDGTHVVGGEPYRLTRDDAESTQLETLKALEAKSDGWVEENV